MGFVVLVVIIGIPTGLIMLLRPRKLWWAAESWKYKNPEANEPSDASYAMTALGGLVVIVASIFIAILGWSAQNDKAEREAEQKQRDEWNAAVQAYQPPKPERRGALPVIGYVVDPVGSDRTQIATAYFLVPPDTGLKGYRSWRNMRGAEQCVASTSSRPPVDGAPAHMTVELLWAPDVPQMSSTASDKCTTRDISSTHEIKSEVITARSDAGFVTDSPIVDRDGKILVPAGPGNVVPKLQRAPQ